jgi:hypothetical protein
MKKIATLLLAFAALVVGTLPLTAQQKRISPHETISTRFNLGEKRRALVTITYGRPYSKDPRSGEIRKIYGSLVRWDKADRLGADEATTLLTQQPLMIGATTIPAGVYTLYIVPSENGTTQLAFSRNLGKWGVPVDENSDVARVDLKKETLPGAPVDQLTLALTAKDLDGTLTITWENTQFTLPFTVQK